MPTEKNSPHFQWRGYPRHMGVLDDETPLEDTPSIISLERLKAEADALRSRNAELGVVIRTDTQGKTKTRRGCP